MVIVSEWQIVSDDKFYENVPPVSPTPGGGHSPHILVGMCRGKVKNGGLRNYSSSVKIEVSGTNIGHPGTDFAGIRGSLELDVVKMRMRCPWMYTPGY